MAASAWSPSDHATRRISMRRRKSAFCITARWRLRRPAGPRGEASILTLRSAAKRTWLPPRGVPGGRAERTSRPLSRPGSARTGRHSGRRVLRSRGTCERRRESGVPVGRQQHHPVPFRQPRRHARQPRQSASRCRSPSRRLEEQRTCPLSRSSHRKDLSPCDIIGPDCSSQSAGIPPVTSHRG